MTLSSQAACVIAGSGLATEHAQAEWRCFHEGTTEERLSLAGRHPDPSQGHSEGTRGIEVAPESEMVGWSQAAAEDCGRKAHASRRELRSAEWRNVSPVRLAARSRSHPAPTTTWTCLRKSSETAAGPETHLGPPWSCSNAPARHAMVLAHTIGPLGQGGEGYRSPG